MQTGNRLIQLTICIEPIFLISIRPLAHRCWR